MIRRSLHLKIIFWIAIILVILLGASFFFTTTISLNALNKEFQETTRRQGALLLNSIYNNIATTTEKGHMQQLRRLTEMVDAVSEVEQLLIFDQTGIVLQSINPEDIGKKVSEIHYSVYKENEQQGRVYDVGAKKEFCLVRPLFNQPRCYGCHDREKRVLGVLDVCISMAATEQRLAQNRKIMFSFGIGAALITILVTSLAIALTLRFMVTSPISRLVKAINEVERGSLNTIVEIRTQDELGRMGHSFNAMVETIRKLNEMKDEFISIVSHELRTPLTSIKYFAEVMLERVGQMETPKQAKYLKVINEETDRLTRLINDLLDLQKISAGKFKWKEEEVDLARIIQSTVTTFSGGAASRSIRIVTHIEKDLPVVLGDADKIVQLLANLLSNAIKFTKIGGKITISAGTGNNPERILDRESFNRYLQVSVQDEGIGITQDNIQRIFDKFHQVEDSFTRSKGGTGLGLSISREIVTHHGGKIWVESEVNVGSTFFFTLPYRPRSVPQGGGPADAHAIPASTRTGA
jgi:signal transduction histidine kinase